LTNERTPQKRFSFKGKGTLYLGLLKNIFFGIAVAAFVYFVVRIVGYYVINNYYLSEENQIKRREGYIAALQQYATSNGLDSDDTVKLAAWAREHPYVYLLIYKDDQLFFTSDMQPEAPPQDEEEGENTEDGSGDKDENGENQDENIGDGSNSSNKNDGQGGIDFGDLGFGSFEEYFGFPVYVDRDVNFLLHNDIAKLGLLGETTVLGFYIGTGFGNAISIGGRLYSGSNGVAGELGHVPIIDSTDVCTCGNVGCIETRCSGKALEELAAQHFPDTDIKKVFKKHKNSPVLKKFVRDLAIPIATQVNILDPDCCIIGGGVVDMEDFPKEVLTDSVKFYTRKPYPEKNLTLIFTKHDQQSGVFGSGDFALNEYLRQIGNNITNK